MMKLLIFPLKRTPQSGRNWVSAPSKLLGSPIRIPLRSTSGADTLTVNTSDGSLSDTDAVSITVPARELQHILAGEAGANTLISLDVDGSSVLTLARPIHRHPRYYYHLRIRRRRATQSRQQTDLHAL